MGASMTPSINIDAQSSQFSGISMKVVTHALDNVLEMRSTLAARIDTSQHADLRM
jgi:hypothetical protein